MSDELTKDQVKEIKDTCNHLGNYGPVSQDLMVTSMQILVITTQNCMRCGRLFTNMSTIPLDGPGTLAIPKPKIPEFKKQ